MRPLAPLLFLLSLPLAAQERGPVRDAAGYVPAGGGPVRATSSELRETLERFTADENALLRRYPALAREGTEPPRWRPMINLRGLQELPLRAG